MRKALRRFRRVTSRHESFMAFDLAAVAPSEILRKISQNFSPAGVTSPFVARAMPTRSSDERLRKYANLVAAAAPARV